MNKVFSKDGTEIAYETKGAGPVVILVDGALGYRALGFGQQLAELLAKHFTVYSYDRRGRGESTDSHPFAVEREVEDIDALIEQAGGSAFVYGISSGACLALEAAIKLGNKIKKLALYEAPYNSDPAALNDWQQYRHNLSKLINSDQRGKAVELFMQFVGTPPDMIDGMQKSPAWPMLEAVAPTLAYDAAAMGEDHKVPVSRLNAIKSQTLVMDGGANLEYMPFMHATAMTIAKSIPDAQHRTLEGQTHNVDAQVLAPVLIEFYKN